MIGKIFSYSYNHLNNLPHSEKSRLVEFCLEIIYGSREEAIKRLKEYLELGLTEKEIEERIKKDFYYSEIMEIKRAFEDINSLPALFTRLREIRNGSFKLKLSPKDFEKLETLNNKMEPGLMDFFHPNNFPEEVAEKVTFTIKETREQLMFKDNRTFKKWLIFFELHRPKDPEGKNRRSFNLLEYMEVWQKFVLDHYEEGSRLLNHQEQLEEIFQHNLVLAKGDLRKLTGDDYRKLQLYVDSLNLPKGVNNFPYTIFQKILQHIEEDQNC